MTPIGLQPKSLNQSSPLPRKSCFSWMRYSTTQKVWVASETLKHISVFLQNQTFFCNLRRTGTYVFNSMLLQKLLAMSPHAVFTYGMFVSVLEVKMNNKMPKKHSLTKDLKMSSAVLMPIMHQTVLQKCKPGFGF